MQRASTPTVSLLQRGCPRNLDLSGFTRLFLPHFHLFSSEKWAAPLSARHQTIVSSPGELLDKQTCSSKAERHNTKCKEFQDHYCHHFRDVVLTTLISQASNCHSCPFFTGFLQTTNGLRSFPLGTKPLCRPHGEWLGKQTRSSKAERHRTTCKKYQHQQCHH